MEALVFDVYGTLVDTGSISAECERLFPGQGAAISAAWRAKQLQYTWLLNSMGSYMDFHEVTRRALVFSYRSAGLGCSSDGQRSLMDAYMELAPFRDVERTLDDLAASGRRLMVLSNGTPEMLEGVLTNSGLRSRFHSVVSVDEVKVFKPDPRVYELAVDRLGLSPEKIGFVSANSWDIAGASRFGLSAVWLNRSGAVAEEVGGKAKAEVTSFADLPNALSPGTV